MSSDTRPSRVSSAGGGLGGGLRRDGRPIRRRWRGRRDGRLGRRGSRGRRRAGSCRCRAARVTASQPATREGKEPSPTKQSHRNQLRDDLNEPSVAYGAIDSTSISCRGNRRHRLLGSACHRMRHALGIVVENNAELWLAVTVLTILIELHDSDRPWHRGASLPAITGLLGAHGLLAGWLRADGHQRVVRS